MPEYEDGEFCITTKDMEKFYVTVAIGVIVIVAVSIVAAAYFIFHLALNVYGISPDASVMQIYDLSIGLVAVFAFGHWITHQGTCF